MSKIDKNLYEKLNSWWRFERPEHQNLLYVNAHNRQLTNNTVRKLMYESDKEDIHGEKYVTYCSADNFYRNMRDYYTEIATLYLCEPGEEDPIEDMIKSIPPTGGWLTLIIENLDTFSGGPDQMAEMFSSLVSFAVKYANVILIGNGDYNDVFSECPYALKEIDDGLSAKEEDNLLMIGLYDQDAVPDTEEISYKTSEEQLNELVFYWDTILEQLNKGYFDFGDFKLLYKETLEYLIPRVIKEHVFRKDLWLIENISDLKKPKINDVNGCTPWELDAAFQFSAGLLRAIVNTNEYNNDFSKGEILFWVRIYQPSEDFGIVHISGHTESARRITVNNCCKMIDQLAETIRQETYEGNIDE